MASYQINILNPKAYKLLKDLADLELIAFAETASSPFLTAVNKMRETAESNSISLEEITEEVEVARAERYAKKKDKGNN